MSDFGVYVHVPFCSHRCDYCAFATYSDRDHLQRRYVDAVLTELSLAREAGLAPSTSVFFGGGTPSRLPAEWLLEILSAIPRTQDAEVTVECNPEDATEERLTAYRTGGVTRMSFGVQSTQPRVLADLGRRHGTGAHRDVARAVAAARFDTWNMDLIVGSRAESLADVRRTLDDILTLDAPPPHVSCYALTAEPGTPLGQDSARHPDEDETADAWELVGDVLESAGYEWEEISNWARPGHECRHNHLYWNQGDYLGVGSAAHSHQGGRRWWNVRTPDRYIDLISKGESVMAGEEVLDERSRQFERESLALRTRNGVPRNAFESIDDVDHLVDERNGVITLNSRGRLLANQVIMRLRSAERD